MKNISIVILIINILLYFDIVRENLIIINCDYRHKKLIDYSISLKTPNFLNMKKLIFTVFIFAVITGCTKSETQYIDQDNKRQSVNNRDSDTINTLQQRSDTLQNQDNLKNVPTDNE